ncbi:MAG: FAD-binding oxidoreductase [Alphaproteobacteria bacterium]|nr:FAD-binding oxidoreductase [Alphaproteobacteria bacterium]
METHGRELTIELENVLGPGSVLSSPDQITPFIREPRGVYNRPAAGVVLPADVNEVASVVRWANKRGVGLIPQSGNTGLVGGQVPLADPGKANRPEVIVSLQRLNKVRGLEAGAGVMTLEAGITVKKAQEIAEEAGALFALSLGSEGSCMIGGVLSTNAGGVNVLAYGSARAQCLGIEAVLANGEIYDGLSPLRKNNTGYALNDLLIGAEGTLGIITAASLRLFPRPVAHETALANVASPQSALDLLDHLRRAGGNRLTSIELMPRLALDYQLKHHMLDADPAASASEWYVLCEYSLFGVDREGALPEALESAMENGIISDAALASSISDRQRLWALREQISPSQKLEGGSIKHDVSVPVAAIPALIERASGDVVAKFPGTRPFAFGHVGDGNIHLNFSQPEGMETAAFKAQEEAVHDIVYEVVLSLGGSISAEHGIGQMKVALLERVKNRTALDMMAAIKGALDPHNIMNPGKVLGI